MPSYSDGLVWCTSVRRREEAHITDSFFLGGWGCLIERALALGIFNQKQRQATHLLGFLDLKTTPTSSCRTTRFLPQSEASWQSQLTVSPLLSPQVRNLANLAVGNGQFGGNKCPTQEPAHRSSHVSPQTGLWPLQVMTALARCGLWMTGHEGTAGHCVC